MNATGLKIPNVRRIGVGGGMLTEQLARDTLVVFNNLKEFVNAYGMTESCGLLTIPPNWGIHHRDIGFPASTVKIKVAYTLGVLASVR